MLRKSNNLRLLERGNFKLIYKGCDTLFREKRRLFRGIINKTMRSESINIMKETGKTVAED